MSAMSDLDAFAQAQRDELRGTSMGRRPNLAPLTPEDDAVVHFRLQHLKATGYWITRDHARHLMEEAK